MIIKIALKKKYCLINFNKTALHKYTICPTNHAMQQNKSKSQLTSLTPAQQPAVGFGIKKYQHWANLLIYRVYQFIETFLHD
jgi:hypothetical protein